MLFHDENVGSSSICHVTRKKKSLSHMQVHYIKYNQDNKSLFFVPRFVRVQLTICLLVRLRFSFRNNNDYYGFRLNSQ